MSISKVSIYCIDIYLFFWLQCKKKFLVYLLSFLFLISLILSVYHVGIENNIFPEFSGCTTNNLNIINKEDLLNSLSEILPNCKDVTF